MQTLKPCPFCGNAPTLNHMGSGSYKVSCSNGHHIDTEASKEKAITAWNTRPGSYSDELEAIVKQAMQDEWEEICSDTGCHPVDIEHGRGRRLSFIPLHWASAVAASVRSQVERSNTRPAAPVEGLGRYNLNASFDGPGDAFCAAVKSKKGVFVRFDQAEAILAAKDEAVKDAKLSRDDWKKLAKDLEADNAALTARVKYFEGAIKTKGGNEHSPTQDAYELACKAIEKHRDRAEALETQLAAVTKALEAIEDHAARCEALSSHSSTATAYLKDIQQEARAALESSNAHI